MMLVRRVFQQRAGQAPPLPFCNHDVATYHTQASPVQWGLSSLCEHVDTPRCGGHGDHVVVEGLYPRSTKRLRTVNSLHPSLPHRGSLLQNTFRLFSLFAFPRRQSPLLNHAACLQADYRVVFGLQKSSRHPPRAFCIGSKRVSQAAHPPPASGKSPPSARRSPRADARGHGSRGSFHR